MAPLSAIWLFYHKMFILQYVFTIFPESDERRVLVVFVFRRGRDVRPGEIRYASGPWKNGNPLSDFGFFIIKCLFYNMFSPFLPRRRAKAAATATQKWSFHNMF